METSRQKWVHKGGSNAYLASCECGQTLLVNHSEGRFTDDGARNLLFALLLANIDKLRHVMRTA